METRRQRRSAVAGVAYQLNKEKHVLRQMRGRRLDDHGPAEFHSTTDPDHPVIVDGGWQRPSEDETEKHSLVRHLQVVQLHDGNVFSDHSQLIVIVVINDISNVA